MEEVGIFYGHFVYFTAGSGIYYVLLVHFVVIWYILWTFGTFCGHLVLFVVIWYNLGMSHREKSGSPGRRTVFEKKVVGH
jgi:hypothetical protein